jgi:protein ImuA
MPAPRPSLRVAFDLPSAVPGVWHADALGAGLQSAQPTGFALLDAQLPGGGWPVGALSEVLQPMAGLHEWQLVLPALAQATARGGGAVVVCELPPPRRGGHYPRRGRGFIRHQKNPSACSL